MSPPTLMEEEIEELMLKCTKHDGSTTLEISKKDLLSLLMEIQGAREAQMPLTLVHYTTMGDGATAWVTRDDIRNAEKYVNEIIESGGTKKAHIYSARLEQSWELQRKFIPVRTK